MKKALLVKRFVQGIAALALVFALAHVARADEYPNRPIRLIIGYGPGAGAGIAMFLIQPFFAKHIGQPLAIEFKPGASSALAAQVVAKAPPDGYTLFLGATSFSTFPARKNKFQFDATKDFVPVADLGDAPFVITALPSFPANTTGELIALAKANPAKLNYGSAGPGVDFLIFEYFKLLSGANIVNVPFKDTAAVDNGVLTGTVEIGISGASAFPLIASKQLKAIAVTTQARATTAPDVPSLSDSFPGFDQGFWMGIFAPKGTPDAVVKKINEAINYALKQPDVIAGMARLNIVASPKTPEEFGRKFDKSVKIWLDIVAKSNLVLE